MSSTYTFDFSERRRLHIAGIAVSFAQFALKFLQQTVIILVIFLVRNPELLRSVYFWLILFGLLVVSFLYSYLYYRSYYYYIDSDRQEFIVESGLLNKSKTVIKFSNIIQVNLNQNVLQKLFSIYSLTINTAGSDKVEVDLYALDEITAQALRQFLMDAIRVEDRAAEEPISAEFSVSNRQTEILQIPAKNILLISLFSNYRQGLALFFAFVVSLYQQINDVVDLLGREEDYELDVSNWRAWISVLLMGAVFILFIPFIINLFRYFFKYYNFTILRNREGNFSMRYGLLNVKEVIFNKTRVQTLSFRQNILLKYLNLGYLTLRQIVTDEAKAADSLIEMPGVTLRDKHVVYDLVFEKDVFADVVQYKPSIGLFVNRMVKANIVLLIIIVLLFFVVKSYWMTFWVAVCIMESLILVYNYLYYKNYRFYVGRDFLIKSTRVWNEEETVVPIQNTQIVEVSQTFWQVRSGSANLYVKTAADNVSFRFFDEKLIKGISNRILYQLER